MSSPATKISVFDPKFGTPYVLDVSPYIKGGQYAMDANGCSAASLNTTLTWEQIESQGWGEGRNGVEISTYDGDSIRTASAAGATKLYVLSTKPYDATLTLEAAQIAIDDGVAPCYFIPVTAVGSDGGGQFVTVGTPLFAGVAGNPSTLPAYGIGARIYRRRWSGRIAQRTKDATRYQKTTLVLQGIGHRLKEILGNFAFNAYDAGQAIYQTIFNNEASFSDLNIAAMTNVTIGSLFTANYTNAFVADVLTNILASIPGDLWTVRLGSDRTPKIVKLYTASTLAYTYTKTFKTTQLLFVPTDVETVDQDTSNMANAVMVVGDTDPQTQNAVTAVADDATSMATYGEIDAAPYAATGVKDQPTAAQFASALLQQNGYPQAQSSFKIAIENSNMNAALASSATGMPEGDQVYGFEAIVLSGFDQQGDIANAVPDSGIQFGSGPDALWSSAASGVVVSASFSPDGQNTWQLPALTGGGVNSPPILCAPGSVWTISGYVYASLAIAASGVYGWLVRDANTGVGIASSYWSADGTTPAVTFTIPADTTAIAVTPYVQARSGASGYVTFAQPNLNRGSSRKPYVVNLAAEAIYGLPSSVTSTFTAAGDRQQQITFAPVVPNINAIIQERANATAAALLANTKTPVSIASFCVSANANTVSYTQTSLNLLYPAFLALFAQGSQLLSIAATTVTLPASTTTWVWLQPSGSFYLQAGPQKVAGAIFMGYYTTNAMGVIGGRFAASIGVFNVGVGNVNANSSLPAPTFSSATVTNGSSLNGIAADVAVSITLTNVPTTGNAAQVAFYYRQSTAFGGSGTWIPYEEQNLTIAAGSLYPSGTQTQTFEYGNLANGTYYDFAVGYVGLAGYGPLTTFQTSFAAKTIGIPAPYMLGGNITPTLSGAVAANGTSANGISAAVVIQFTCTNQPTDGSLSRVQIWTRRSGVGGSNTIGGTGFAWSPYGDQPAVGVGSTLPSASGSYSFVLADMTNGVSYDFGVTYENTQGGESIVAAAVTNFAASAVNIPPTSLGGGTLNVLADGFAGLIPDPSGSGNLIMPGSGGLPLYIAQTEEYLLPAGTVSVLAQFTFKARFQLTNVGTEFALDALTDSGLSGTTWSNGYQLVYGPGGSTGKLRLQKRVGGAGTDLFNATTAASNVPGLSTSTPAVPVPDLHWHELKMTIARNPLYFSSGTLAIGIFFDGVSYGYFYEQTASSGGPTRFASNKGASGGNVGGSAPFVAGYCALEAAGTAANILIDSTDLAITNGNDGVSLASTVSSSHASESDVVAAQTSGTTIESPLISGIISARHLIGAPASDTGAVIDNSGLLLYTRQPAAVTGTVTPTAGSEGSFLAAKTVARRHVLGDTGTNLVQNPTGRYGFNGWTLQDNTGHASAGYDNFLGGRFEVTVAGGSGHTGTDAYLVSTPIPCFGGFAYTISGKIEVDSVPSGGYAIIDVYDNSSTANFYYPATVAVAGQNPISLSFTTASGATRLTVRLRVYTGGTSPSVATTAYFYGVQLEVGSFPTPFHDATSAALAATSHDTVAGGEGSFFSAGQVSARHLYGGNASDAGALVDSTSRLLQARHAPVIDNSTNIHISCSGQMPYMSGLTLTVPSTLIVFRSDGSYCRTGPTTATLGTAYSFGAWYIVWTSGGTGAALGFVSYNSASYKSIITNPVYQVIGFMNGDSGSNQFMSPWITSQHMSTLQATFPIGTVGSSVNAPASTFMNQQASILPYTTDVVLTLTAPSGGTQINASTNAGHFYRPDGSSVAASASAHNFTGLTSGATYYVVAYCPYGGGSMTFAIAGSSNFTPAAYAAYLGDGFALLVSPVATPAVGSGGTGGGGGCPGVDQTIETREAGFIRAGDVATGMRVRHPDDSWRVVEWAGKPHAALMYRVTFDTEAIVVDASHLFERELGSDRWTNVAALEPGDRFCRSRGQDELRVRRIERLGNGLFVPLHVDGMRYRLGRTVSHNAKNHLQ